MLAVEAKKPINERVKATLGFTPTTLTYKKLNSTDDTIVMTELDTLCQPANYEQRKNLFISAGEEQSKSFKLLRKLINSGDQEISSKAFRLLELYLQDTRTIAPINSSPSGEQKNHRYSDKGRKQEALRDIVAYLKTNDEPTRNQLTQRIALNLGYFYCENGDDRLQTVSTGDDRLRGFFDSLQKNPSQAQKLIYDLLIDGTDFLSKNSELRANPPAYATNDPRISISLAQKDRASSHVTTNGAAHIGILTYAGVITCKNDDERKLLKTMNLPGINPDSFKLSYADLIDAVNYTGKETRGNTIKYSRAEIVEHLTAAYFVLQFRKRGLEEEIANGMVNSLKQNSKVKAIDREIKRFQATLNQVYALDKDGTVQDKLRTEIQTRIPDCFLYSIQGTTTIAEITLNPIADKLLGQVHRDYGAAIPHVTETGYKGLVATEKATREAKSQLVNNLSTKHLQRIIPGEDFLDYNRIQAFTRAITSWNPDMTDLKALSSPEACAEYARRAASIDTGLPTPKDVLDLEKATTSFKDFLTSNPDASVQYVLANWDKIFKNDLASFKLEPNGSYESKGKAIPHDSTSLFKYMKAKIEDSLKEAKDQGGAVEGYLKSADYEDSLRDLLYTQEEKLEAASKLVREALNDFRAKDEDIYNRLDRSGSVVEHLLNRTLEDDSLIAQSGSNSDTKSRLCGVMLLGRKIQLSTSEPWKKEQALDLIARDLLGLTKQPDIDSFKRSLIRSKRDLDRACNASLTSVIAGNINLAVPDAALLLEYEVAGIDMREHGIQKAEERIQDKNEEMLQGYIKLMFGDDYETVNDAINSLSTKCNDHDLQALQELHENIKTASTPDEKTEATKLFLENLAGIFGKGFASRFINTDLLGDLDLTTSMSLDSIFDDGRGFDIFRTFSQLWKYLLSVLSNTDEKPKVLPPEPNYHRTINDTRRLSA